MDKLKYALLEVKNIFNNIPMMSKIFMLIYLIMIEYQVIWTIIF